MTTLGINQVVSQPNFSEILDIRNIVCYILNYKLLRFKDLKRLVLAGWELLFREGLYVQLGIVRYTECCGPLENAI